MMTLARVARALIVGLIAASVVIGVGGCTTYATPDGHTLWSANGPNDVERVLGEADLVIERPKISALGHWVRTEMTYIDRGYVVYLSNSRVRGTTPITEDRKDLKRRSTVYKNVLKGRIKRGDTGAAVIKALGEPNIVWKERIDNGVPRGDGFGPYVGQFEESPPAYGAEGYWDEKDVYVELEYGRVYQFWPMTIGNREQLLNLRGFLNERPSP